MESRVVFLRLFIEIAEFIKKLFIGFSKFKPVKAVASVGRKLDTCFLIFHEIPPIDPYIIVNSLLTINIIVYVNLYIFILVYNK